MTQIKVKQIKSKPTKGIVKARGHVAFGMFGSYWKRTKLQIVFI